MGLEKGFKDGKYYLKGFRFIRWYNTEEELIADRGNAFACYQEELKAFRTFSNMLASLR